MVKGTFRVIWYAQALKAFDKILQYIHKESPAGAKIVKNAILTRVDSIKKNPFISKLDDLKLDNDGSYRAFVVFHYRVSYKVSEKDNTVIILRVRHTSREPLEF